MLDVDKTINDYVNELSGLYLRYSDDFLVALPNVCENKAKIHCDWLLNFINSTPGLELHSEKTNSYNYENKNIIDSKLKSDSCLDYLGFVFDGQKVKIRPKAISKYHYRLYKKSRAIGMMGHRTKYGKTISYKNIYDVYSTTKTNLTNEKHSNFIDYIKRADQTLSLNDPESQSIKNNHKAKVRKAINRAKEKYS